MVTVKSVAWLILGNKTTKRSWFGQNKVHYVIYQTCICSTVWERECSGPDTATPPLLPLGGGISNISQLLAILAARGRSPMLSLYDI